jgi:sterol 14-demethylase
MFAAVLAVIVGSLLCVRYAWLVYCARRAVRANRVPVVPHAVPWLGHAIAFGSDHVALFRTCAAKFGAVFSLTLAGQSVVVVSDADLWRTALRTPATTAGMSELLCEVIALFWSAVMSESEARASQTTDAKAIRGDIQSSAQLSELTRRAQAALAGTVSDWDGSLSLRVASSTAIFRASVAALFGASALCVDSDAVCSDMLAFDWGLMDKIKGMPAWLSGDLRTSNDAIARIVRSAWFESIRGAPDKSALIAGMQQRIVERVRGGAALPSDEAAGMIALLWAATINSMNAAFFALYYVARDLDLQARIRAEAMRASAAGTLALDCLPLVDSLITETLRLHGGGGVPARCTGDQSVDALVAKSTLPGRSGQTITAADLPPRTRIIGALGCMFFDTQRFADADTFVAERFLDAGKEQTAIVELVFGGGSHMCPGRHFIRNELRAFIATICLHFDMRCDAPRAPKQRVGELNTLVQSPIEDCSIEFQKK